ncbi:DEAD/DEAH box helicase [Bacillaceae bacterium SIJ1]|uniref:DEAD/DEAH box helicase n=1 Tax=Litoribacterium kuwaitense TaxID=1398745 RepID=UPI0013EA752D|nr:DEAD/DEAH box helicase [Litoribacterium kuwaitense]NGP45730.1 DEAD/DEAH box helicase [Litoribacterium kuwaitense]
MTSFNDFSLHPHLLNALEEKRIQQPTDIQRQTIPMILRRKDVIAQAQTGTGKTLAYLLPILHQLDASNHGVQALIVAPTRELALQITAEASDLLAHDDMDVLALYGGQQVEQQLKRLEGKTPIVVATPGRLLDHLNRGTLRLGSLRFLVLDEADQMLDIGFLADMEEIITRSPGNRHMVLCSATMPQPIQKLARRYMKAPVTLKSESDTVTVKEIKQWAVETTARAKKDNLVTLIHQLQPFLAIVFCRTKRRASELNGDLLEAGLLSDELHGDLSQAKRERIMKQFRDAKLQVLVATDVAARGLDVEGITHVFNYDVPPDAEQYVHRIGRTGRAGASGLAVTLVTPGDVNELRRIERGIQMTLKRQVVEEGRLVSKGEASKRRAGRKETTRKPNSRQAQADSTAPSRGKQKGRKSFGKSSGPAGGNKVKSTRQAGGRGRTKSQGRRGGRSR